MRCIARAGTFAFLVATAGCGADFNSIGRTTALPTGADGGVAIHLDAQQRLTLFRAQKYCAEPSPDALAAYAQSLGLGVSIPTQGAGSLAGASQSTIGSIGLRTQSITIMRDALYRMCEAYHNQMLGDVMVATLLGRSQDLAAVILAVEQLTGAVAGNQVILTGTAGANASASLLANDQALAAAQDNVTKRKAAVADATAKQAKAQTAFDEATAEEASAKRQLDAAKAKSPPVQSEIESAQTAYDNVKAKTAIAKQTLDEANSELKNKKEQLANAEKVLETIQAGQDAAITNAAATTSGGGSFGVINPRRELSSDATKEIASAVHGIVSKALDKSYAADSCMALITSANISEENSKNEHFKKVFELCAKLVSQGIAKALRIETTFDAGGSDPNIIYLREEIAKNESLLNTISRWLRDNNINAAPNNIVSDKEYVEERKRLIEFLKTKT